MTRTLDDAIRAGCELNPVSSHRAGHSGITFEANRHTAAGRVCCTEIDKGLCRRTCLETCYPVYNAASVVSVSTGASRIVIPARAKSYYSGKCDSRRIRGEKVVTREVAA